MLKITTRIEPGAAILILEGKLAGPWVKELEQSWRAAPRPMSPLWVNLSEVTFIDQEGKELLARMHRNGVALLAAGCLNRSIVEEIIRPKGKISSVLKQEEGRA